MFTPLTSFNDSIKAWKQTELFKGAMADIDQHLVRHEGEAIPDDEYRPVWGGEGVVGGVSGRVSDWVSE